MFKVWGLGLRVYGLGLRAFPYIGFERSIVSLRAFKAKLGTFFMVLRFCLFGGGGEGFEGMLSVSLPRDREDPVLLEFRV